MQTFFAPAERATEDQLANEIAFVSKNSVMNELLRVTSGLLAVLDEHRQIVTTNDTFLKAMGIEDAAAVLGLRPGEALGCVHAQEKPGGCGTTKYCATCGAAVAIVASLSGGEPVERKCAMTIQRDGRPQDLALRVQAHALRLQEVRYVLLFVQDISQEERRAALERTFFHDINNMLGMIIPACDMLEEEQPSALTRLIRTASVRLSKEVYVQECLSGAAPRLDRLASENGTTAKALEDLEAFYTLHPAAKGKRLDISRHEPEVAIRTDLSLLLRVLCNMVTNALEATAPNGAVKVWTESEGGRVSFLVWNAQEIPADVAARVFQRNFSTKDQPGRGLGTYSMRLIGEKILGGEVSFTTAPGAGTTFRFVLPAD
jgi:signal transduction histidine kinase